MEVAVAFLPRIEDAVAAGVVAAGFEVAGFVGDIGDAEGFAQFGGDVFAQVARVAGLAGFEDAVAADGLAFAVDAAQEDGLFVVDVVFVVALLARDDDAITAYRGADGLSGVEETGELEREVGTSEHAFGMEELDFVDAAFVDVEVGIVVHRDVVALFVLTDDVWDGLEGAASALEALHAAQVDEEFVVDEHPDVVVAPEGKGLATFILEIRVEFACEAADIGRGAYAVARVVDGAELTGRKGFAVDVGG